MKRSFIFLIAALATLAWGANARTDSHVLGYCDGQVKTGATDGFSISDADQDISAAIFIPRSVAKVYAGCEIRQINAGLASTLNVETLAVWIRSTLDGEDLAGATLSKSSDPAIKKGWNSFTLPASYTIPSDTRGFYIGLTFHQKGNSVGLSVVQDLPVVENSLWVKLGNNADWTDRSPEGILPLEAIVTGENLPKVNLTLTALKVQPSVSISNGEIAGSVTVANRAEAVTGFDIICSVNDRQDTQVVRADATLAYKESKEFPFTLSFEGLAEGEHTLNVRIAGISEGEDANPDDNAMSAPFTAVSLFFPRKVLVEEFTTERCSNCPRVAGYMHEMLETAGADGRVIPLCHHSGFGTDWLTIPADVTYLWLFGRTNPFAPAIKVDRFTADYLPGYNNESSVLLPMSAEELSEAVTARKNVPAYVCLDLDVELTDGNAHVKVTGEGATESFTKNQPRIVVGLVEDNIPAREQAGLEEGQTYTQQHVNRAYNSIWGEYLEFNGNSYSYECDLAVKPEYVKENLSVVAYIWDYDPSEAEKCEVANANAIYYADMTDNTSSLSDISADTDGTVRYFSIDGLPLAAPADGITIVRRADGSTCKIMR